MVNGRVLLIHALLNQALYTSVTLWKHARIHFARII